ncbi:MAG: PQQ-binding-like beta-propeller repeat protein [Gaiellales bacterium]
MASPSRQPRRHLRWGLIGVGLLAVIAALGAGTWFALGAMEPEEVEGSATVEFTPPPATLTVEETDPVAPWPTYGFDDARTRWNPDLEHRPPYTERWRFRSRSLLEFPPVVADGRLFVGQLRGRFYAVDTSTGGTIWEKDTGHCSAASPAYADGVVYAAFLADHPCPKGEFQDGGFVVAWDAASGAELWRVEMAPVESSPLVVDDTVYVGAWDAKVYALDARTGVERWSTELDAQIVASATLIAPEQAGDRAAITIGTNGGTLYALDAETGAINWEARSNDHIGSGREYFYATPTVAYGRVYVGNTDGWMYAYGAQSGNLLWAKQAGSYVYTAAAVADEVVYIGTYDGYVIAYDAATGAERWRVEMPGAVHGAPTLMAGLLYVSTCSGCGQNGVRESKRGPDATYAIDVTTREIVWEFPAGKYSPIVADTERVYLVGTGVVFGLDPS